jgi:hypothetical protein
MPSPIPGARRLSRSRAFTPALEVIGIAAREHGKRRLGYFLYRRDEFLAHYDKRSNAESTFSMIKRKFGDSLRSKTATAQVNETLTKVLCHNPVVLIHEMYELGIAPIFWGNDVA